MVSSVGPLMQGSAATTGKEKASDPSSKLASEQTFLQLLVAQLKNQNPLNPADGLQFVTQLAQFSQLEQMIALRQDADAIRDGLLGQPQS